MTGAPCAAFRPSQARVLCASAPLPEPRALLLWPGPHRQLRPLRVSPRRAVQARQAARSTPDCKPGTAQAEEPSEQGEGGDDEDQAWFVCPCRVCSEVASKAARRDVEEQAASAQTTDLVEDAPKASERAVGLRFCFWFRSLWPLPAGAGRAAAEERGGSSQNRKQMCLANTAAKAHQSIPAPGRSWPQPDEHEGVQKAWWKNLTEWLWPCGGGGDKNFKPIAQRPMRSKL